MEATGEEGSDTEVCYLVNRDVFSVSSDGLYLPSVFPLRVLDSLSLLFCSKKFPSFRSVAWCLSHFP